MEQIKKWERVKATYFVVFRSIICVVFLLNFFLVPFRFAFLYDYSEEDLYYFFLWDILTYTLNFMNYFGVRQQLEDEVHKKMYLKLGNSFVRDQMKKLRCV